MARTSDAAVDKAMRQASSVATEEALKECVPEKLYALCESFCRRASLSSWHLFLPILSLTCLLLGPHATVEVEGHEWEERLLLWCIIVAYSAIGKTPAFKKLKQIATAVETKINERIKTKALEDKDEDEEIKPFSFFAKSATLEALFQELKHDVNHARMMFLEEFGYFFAWMDGYKKGEGDRTQILSLKGGSSWDRETVGRPNSSIPFTHFIPSGYMQPQPLSVELFKTPKDGLLNRFLITFIPGVFEHLDKLKISGDDWRKTITDFDDLLMKVFLFIFDFAHNIDTGAALKRAFVVRGEAYKMHASFFDKVQDFLAELASNSMFSKAGVFGKVKGEALQIAAALHILVVMLKEAENPETGDSLDPRDEMLEISSEAMDCAIKISQLVLKQRVLFEGDESMIRFCNEFWEWELPDLDEDSGDDDGSRRGRLNSGDVLSEEQLCIKRFFQTFKDEVINITAVVSKKTFGKKQDIIRLWDHLSSHDDDDTHFFGSTEAGTLPGMVRPNDLFRKIIPSCPSEYLTLCNRLQPAYLPRLPTEQGGPHEE
ncbi:hypothetical protein KFL_006790050 [Klebsormidium nitens]|uniref:Uncharacterized protein n=1 Tax=Klebsormidium nitens TaxID=105231 RepID=A0A1Y1IKS3_KLENI|nr:hypothetical protein KFL_006790050 [Klebsormidium nitens]|eukprot:GAQ90742.1 hypothetical protein KFL_006790050 [Klebsormidium nitens]